MNRIHPSPHRRLLRTGMSLTLLALMLGAASPGDLRAEGSGPSITSLEPAEGVAGTEVTIRGSHFGPRVGALQGTSGVSFSGVWVTPSGWNDGEIRAVVPPGASSGPVMVSVGGQESAGVPFTVTGPGTPVPAIATVSPLLGPPGTRVTIRGANFHSSQGAATVTFNGVEAEPGFWSEEEIRVAVPEGALPGPVVVRVKGEASRGVRFEVAAAGPAPPSLDWMGPLSGPEGTTVRIEGERFGSPEGAGQGTSGVSFAGVWATPSHWSGTLIEVPVPEGAPSGPVVVSVEGRSSGAVGFTVMRPPPVIHAVTPVHGPEGSLVRIEGTHFGPLLGARQGRSGVRFDAAWAEPVSWSDGAIEVAVPEGVWGGPVVVRVDGRESNPWAFTVTGAEWGEDAVPPEAANRLNPPPGAGRILASVASAEAAPGAVTLSGTESEEEAGAQAAPLLKKMNPKSGPVGTVVNLRGNNFQSSQGTSTVTFNGVAGTPTSWKGKRIEVPVPSGATTGAVVVTVNGLASNGMTFTVTGGGPDISGLSPDSGPVGTSVAIAGTWFGAVQGTSTVSFNGVGAAPTSWSDTGIDVPVPAGATSGPVVVTVDGQASAGVTFTVTPGISGLSPDSGPVGTSVAITGTSFGDTQGTSTVTFNGVEGTPGSWSDTGIGVPVPEGATSGPVVVTVDGQGSNGVEFTVTGLAPSITKLNPDSGPVGTVVTVRGNNFQSSQGSSTLTFNGVVATPTIWKGKRIEAPVPAGATSGPVVVTVDGQGSNGVEFTVGANQAPVAVGTIPAQTVDSGADLSLDVSGYFSDPDGDPLNYTVQSSDVAAVTVTVSGSTVTVSGVARGDATVTVTASDGSLTAEQVFTATVPNGAPVAVGTIPVQTVDSGADLALEVSSYFSDPDGDALSYTVQSSNVAAKTTLCLYLC